MMKNCIFLILILASCGQNDSKGIVELPPSKIYADNDSTLLGLYSNIGKKEPNLAPYFCASLEKDLQELFSQKDSKGNFIYHKKDRSAYDIFKDQLNIYTSINPSLQEYAKTAIRKHLATDLQPAFSKNNLETECPPFSNTYNGRKVSDEIIKKILNRAQKNSSRYQASTKSGISEKEVLTSFDIPVKMKVFSWQGERKNQTAQNTLDISSKKKKN